MSYEKKGTQLADLAIPVSANKVFVSGKLSRVGKLKYLPSGLPILDFTIAVPQERFGKVSVGYFEMEVSGSLAEDWSGRFRVGQGIKVQGSLWMRNYRNRQGVKVTETQILIESIEGESNEKK